jgi:hypothetical protein
MRMRDFLENAVGFVKGWALVISSLVLGATALVALLWFLMRLWGA